MNYFKKFVLFLALLGHTHLIHAAYCYTSHVLWSVTSVYLSVCLLSLLVSAAVTVERIEMSFDGQKAYL